MEAGRHRPGIAEHPAVLPGIIPLAFPAALALAADTAWAQARARCTVAPTPEHPDSAVVATADPHRWKGEPARVVELTP
ncbi:hypothetical protein ABT263_21320 [Kitasatospora sp. NPDC001603]|uniref:hypothetical protein n=1 Tax=Kitasatospora sp. NPDC001603 TaxID=3154388 RepID=UPI0033187858